MTRADILDAVRRGCDNTRQIADYFGVDLDEARDVVSEATNSGHLVYAPGCCRSLEHFDNCELTVPAFRLSPVGAR